MTTTKNGRLGAYKSALPSPMTPPKPGPEPTVAVAPSVGPPAPIDVALPSPGFSVAGAEVLHTLHEVALHFKVSVDAVRLMIAGGTLPAVCLKPGTKTSRHLRVRASDLANCIRTLGAYGGCPSQRPKPQQRPDWMD